MLQKNISLNKELKIRVKLFVFLINEQLDGKHFPNSLVLSL